MKRNIYGKEITTTKNNDSLLKNYYNFTNIPKWTSIVYPQDKQQKPYTPPRKVHKSSLADTVHQSAIVDLTDNEQTSNNTTFSCNPKLKTVTTFLEQNELSTPRIKALYGNQSLTPEEKLQKIIKFKKIKEFNGLKSAAIKFDSPEVLEVIIGKNFTQDATTFSKNISTALRYKSFNVLEYLITEFPNKAEAIRRSKMQEVSKALEQAKIEGKVYYSSEKTTNELDQNNVVDKISAPVTLQTYEWEAINYQGNNVSQVPDSSPSQDINDFLDQIDQYDDTIKKILSKPPKNATDEDDAFVYNLLAERSGDLPNSANCTTDQEKMDAIFDEFSTLLGNC